MYLPLFIVVRLEQYAYRCNQIGSAEERDSGSLLSSGELDDAARVIIFMALVWVSKCGTPQHGREGELVSVTQKEKCCPNTAAYLLVFPFFCAKNIERNKTKKLK